MKNTWINDFANYERATLTSTILQPFPSSKTTLGFKSSSLIWGKPVASCDILYMHSANFLGSVHLSRKSIAWRCYISYEFKKQNIFQMYWICPIFLFFRPIIKKNLKGLLVLSDEITFLSGTGFKNTSLKGYRQRKRT